MVSFSITEEALDFAAPIWDMDTRNLVVVYHNTIIRSSWNDSWNGTKIITTPKGNSLRKILIGEDYEV